MFLGIFDFVQINFAWGCSFIPSSYDTGCWKTKICSNYPTTHYQIIVCKLETDWYHFFEANTDIWSQILADFIGHLLFV